MKYKIFNKVSLLILLCWLSLPVLSQVNIFTDTIESTCFPHNVELIRYESHLNTSDTANVIFFLHGFNGSPENMLNHGLEDTLNKHAQLNQLNNTVMVLPNGYNTYYINNYNDSVQWATMFFEELIPYIFEKYPAARLYLAGFSMGGYGAFSLFLNHPDMFKGVLSISGAFRTDETLLTLSDDRYNLIYKSVFGPEKEITEHWKLNNPFHRLQDVSIKKLSNKQLIFICGEKDYLLPGNKQLSDQLLEHNILHEFQIYPGMHNALFMLTHVMDGLQYLIHE